MFCLLSVVAAVTVVRRTDTQLDGAPIVTMNASENVEGIDSVLLEPIHSPRSEEIAFAEMEGFDPERTSIWSKKLETKRTKLGAGSFGAVFLVRPKCDNTKSYAMKVQKPRSAADRSWPIEMNSEVKLMLQFNSPRFVQILDYGFGKAKGGKSHSILMEAANSDLGKYTSRDNSWEQVVVFMADLLEGIAEMHKAGVVHRDLKPGNVLVKCEGVSKCHAKIADLGMSCKLGHRDCSGIGGTPIYFAPELLKSKAPALSNDMWGMGAMMFELLFKKLPDGINGRTLETLYANIKKIKDPTAYISEAYVGARMKGASQEVISKAYTLLTGLLAPNSAKRLTATDAAALAQELVADVKVDPLSAAALPECWNEEAAPVQPKEPEPEPEPAKGVVESIKESLEKIKGKIFGEEEVVDEGVDEEGHVSVAGEEDFVPISNPGTNVAASFVLEWASGKSLSEIQKTSSKYLPKALRAGKFELLDINGNTPEQIKADRDLREGLKGGVFGNLVVHVKKL